MTDLTRRGFVKGSAGAAAGMTMLSAFLAEQAEAHGQAGAHPVVAYVHNPKKGQIWVMSPQHKVVIHDKKLAERLSRAVH